MASRNRLDGEPVKLNILADGEIGAAARVTLGNTGDRAQLVGTENAVGDANAEHEVVGRFSLAAFAAHGADAVTLRVNTPPAEVDAGPLGQHRGAAFARELANFVERLPRVLRLLEAFDALRLGFLSVAEPPNDSSTFSPEKQKTR